MMCIILIPYMSHKRFGEKYVMQIIRSLVAM